MDEEEVQQMWLNKKAHEHLTEWFNRHYVPKIDRQLVVMYIQKEELKGLH